MADNGNVLSFKPPGFNQTLHIKFPEGRLAVCDKCKKNYKTRDMCRVRNKHTDPPWSTAYICITLDESCIDSNNKLKNKVYTVKLNQWHPYSAKKPFNSKTPVCAACKKTNRTRAFCRDRHQHKQLPWCAVYVILSCSDESESDNNMEATVTTEKSEIETATLESPEDENGLANKVKKDEESSIEKPEEPSKETDSSNIKDETSDENQTPVQTRKEENDNKNEEENYTSTKLESSVEKEDVETKSPTEITSEQQNEESRTKDDSEQDKVHEHTSNVDTATNLSPAPEEKRDEAEDEKETERINGSILTNTSEKAPEKKEMEPSSESDDIDKIDKSRTFLALVSSKSITIQWLDLADYDSLKNSPYFPNGQGLSNQRAPIMTGSMPGIGGPYYPPMFPNPGFAPQQALQLQQQHFLQMQQRQQFVAQQALQNQFPMMLNTGQQGGNTNDFVPPAQGQSLSAPNVDAQETSPDPSLQAQTTSMQNPEILHLHEDNTAKKEGEESAQEQQQQQQAQFQAQWQAQMLYQQQFFQQQLQMQQQGHSNPLLMQQPGTMINQQFVPQFQQMQVPQQMLPNQPTQALPNSNVSGVGAQPNSTLQHIQAPPTNQLPSDSMQGTLAFTSNNQATHPGAQSLPQLNLMPYPLQNNTVMSLHTSDKNLDELKRKEQNSNGEKRNGPNGDDTDIEYIKKAKI